MRGEVDFPKLPGLGIYEPRYLPPIYTPASRPRLALVGFDETSGEFLSYLGGFYKHRMGLYLVYLSCQYSSTNFDLFTYYDGGYLDLHGEISFLPVHLISKGNLSVIICAMFVR